MLWNDRLTACDCFGLTSRCVLVLRDLESNATFWCRPGRLLSQVGPCFYPTEPFHMLSLPPRPEKVSLEESMSGHLAILGRVEVSSELASLTASKGSVLRQNTILFVIEQIYKIIIIMKKNLKANSLQITMKLRKKTFLGIWKLLLEKWKLLWI